MNFIELLSVKNYKLQYLILIQILFKFLYQGFCLIIQIIRKAKDFFKN